MRFFRFRSMFESAVSPLGCRISTQHSKSDARRHGACWCTELQCLRSHPFHPHHFTLSLSLSLSLSHAHTHTLTFRAASCYDFAVACCGQSLRAILAPKMLRSLSKNHPDFLFSSRDFIAPPPPPPPSLSRFKQRSVAKSESSIVLD